MQSRLEAAWAFRMNVCKERPGPGSVLLALPAAAPTGSPTRTAYSVVPASQVLSRPHWGLGNLLRGRQGTAKREGDTATSFSVGKPCHPRRLREAPCHAPTLCLAGMTSGDSQSPAAPRLGDSLQTVHRADSDAPRGAAVSSPCVPGPPLHNLEASPKH